MTRTEDKKKARFPKETLSVLESEERAVVLADENGRCCLDESPAGSPR